MPPGSRIPLPTNKHPSYRARAPDLLQAGDMHDYRSLPYVQPLEQFSPPLHEPPPPVPPRSPARALPRGTPMAERLFNSGTEQDMLDPFRDDISASASVYSEDEGVVDAEIAEDPTNRGSTNANGKENSTKFTTRNPRYPLRAQDRESLTQFLLFRGRLQQMGATFSPVAELVTYGNPASKAEFEQMLRLGQLYEEKWEQHFGRRNADSDRTTALWPDIRVLKRMLQNEGIRFDNAHNRLDHSGRDPKVDRLCAQYDGLLNKWIVQTRNVHPAFRRSLEDDQVFESVPQSSRGEPTVPRNLGWSFIRSDNDRESVVVQGANRRSSRLTNVTEDSEPTEEQDAAQQPCEASVGGEHAIDGFREPRNRGESRNVRRMRKWLKKALGFRDKRRST